jgi:site-specific recombinase
MTAPALAAKLRDIDTPQALAAFVGEVTHLVRSQVAAVIGNVGAVVPAVLLLSLAMQAMGGRPLIDAPQARYVLESLPLLGTSPLFAALTGGVLFASSLIAGWVENGFVFHRLDSALRHNPRFTRLLGAARADRWARFLRQNVSGLASNISLGLMLGMIPSIALFFGLALDLRHVTLSSGQLGAAAASLGLAVLRMPEFWWCVASIPVIGALNLGVSFYFAFRLAILSHGIGAVDRARLRHAVVQRLLHRPLSFLWPVAQPTEATAERSVPPTPEG